MELTSVHHKSGQLVQRSNVVHVISVQPQEVYCFTVSADKKINITNERRTKLTQKHLEHVGYLIALQDSNTTCGNMFEYRQVAQKTVATVQTFLQSFQKMAICTWHMNLFLALLGLPSLSNFFICRRRMSIFCLRGQTRAIPVQIHCQYAGGACAACPWPPASPNPPESGFHAYHTFCYIPQPISPLVVALSHLFVALSHPFSGIS